MRALWDTSGAPIRIDGRGCYLASQLRRWNSLDRRVGVAREIMATEANPGAKKLKRLGSVRAIAIKKVSF